MPAETACRDYPFPLDTDVIDVAQHIEDLARAVDADICGRAGQIDDLQNEMALRVRKSGDTMTGLLTSNVPSNVGNISLRRAGNAPFIEYRDVDGTPRFGYSQGQDGVMRQAVEASNGVFVWNIGTASTSEVMRLGAGGNLQLDASIRAGGAGFFDAFGSFGGNGQQIRVVDTSGGSVETPNAYIGYFRSGTSQAPTNRGAYTGFAGSSTFYVRNEVSGGSIVIQSLAGTGSVSLIASGAGSIALAAGATGDVVLDAGDDIIFQTNQITRGVMNGQHFLWGKSASDFAVVGLEMHSTGGTEGNLWSTCSGAGSPNISLRRRGSASADNQWLIHCVRDDGTSIGGIQMNGTPVSSIQLIGTATSDYRVKEELGLIEDGLQRTMMLRPIRYLRTDEDTGIERDGLIAHEVAEIVPEAVSGEKDAVQSSGAPLLQEMHGERLVPLLVAAIQELNGIVTELKAEIRTLREDCCG